MGLRASVSHHMYYYRPEEVNVNLYFQMNEIGCGTESLSFIWEFHIYTCNAAADKSALVTHPNRKGHIWPPRFFFFFMY